MKIDFIAKNRSKVFALRKSKHFESDNVIHIYHFWRKSNENKWERLGIFVDIGDIKSHLIVVYDLYLSKQQIHITHIEVSSISQTSKFSTFTVHTC